MMSSVGVCIWVRVGLVRLGCLFWEMIVIILLGRVVVSCRVVVVFVLVLKVLIGSGVVVFLLFR